jgi:hypothetical protein
MKSVLLAAAVLLVTPSASAQKQDCVTFGSNGKLARGASFVKELFPGLEFRLDAEDALGWSISVREGESGPNLMWVVSPPFQTAPQRHIGPVYGLTARESVGFDRSLRFVLNRNDYDRAEAIVRNDLPASETSKRLEDLGRGTLSIRVTNFAIDQTTGRSGTADALAWIEFEARACRPER